MAQSLRKRLCQHRSACVDQTAEDYINVCIVFQPKVSRVCGPRGKREYGLGVGLGDGVGVGVGVRVSMGAVT